MRRRFSVAFVERIATLVTLLAGTSCYGFELVSPNRERETLLGLTVHVREDSNSIVDVSGVFSPGLDAAGRPRRTDSVLVVNGQPLPLSRTGDYLNWNGRLLGPRRPDTLRVTLPRLLDTTDAPRTLVLPLIHSDTPYDVTLAQGGDLHLHVSPPSQPVEYTTWRLLVGGQCEPGASVTFESWLPYPSDLAMPWSLLAPVAPTLSGACFRTTSGWKVRDLAYAVWVSQSAEIRWRVSVTASRGAP